METANFSVLSVFLLILGWLTHWAITMRRVKAVAMRSNRPPPTWWSYWRAGPESLLLSITGTVAGYVVLPWLGQSYPDLAAFLGSTAENPANPLACYLGGFFMPNFADLAGRRISALLRLDDDPQPPDNSP